MWWVGKFLTSAPRSFPPVMRPALVLGPPPIPRMNPPPQPPPAASLRPPLPLVTHPGVYFPHQKQHQPDRDHRVERTVAIQPLVHRPKLDFVFL